MAKCEYIDEVHLRMEVVSLHSFGSAEAEADRVEL